MEDRFILPPRKPSSNINLHCQEPSQQFSVAECLKYFIQNQQIEGARDQLLSFRSEKKISKRKIGNFDMSNMPDDKNIFGLNFGNLRENPVLVHKPERNLEAITLTDNHEASLIDCSFKGILAVGLSKGIYLWNQKGEITRIRQKPGVWSLKWSPCLSNILACGSDRGSAQIWDIEKNRLVYQAIDRDRGGINTLTFNDKILFTGSQDGSVFEQDIRVQRKERRVSGFKGYQILTLKFHPQNNYFLGCSEMDGNLKIWDARNRKVGLKITVKNKESANSNFESRGMNFQNRNEKNVIRAFDWHPKNHNLLVYGDNTAVETSQNFSLSSRSNKSQSSLCVVNISENNPQQLKAIKTNSDICNLCFSADGNHLYSSHGPAKNEIYSWASDKGYRKEKVFAGHDARVLYLTVNEVEQTVISGAGDESIKFWKLENENRNVNKIRDFLMQIR